MKHTRIASLIATASMFAFALPTFAATTTSVTAGSVTGKKTDEIVVMVGKNAYTTTEGTGTKYWDRNGRVLNATEIMVGDKVWVWGKKNVSNHTITDVAKVKDLSLGKTNISGKVTSLATDELGVKVGKVTYTTTETAGTKYWNRSGATTSVSTLKVGDMVKVWGLKDTATKTVSHVSDVKDLSR